MVIVLPVTECIPQYTLPNTTLNAYKAQPIVVIILAGDSGANFSHAMDTRKRATEIELVECVEGNPYSKATEGDMVSLCTGGESGLGRHKKSYSFI